MSSIPIKHYRDFWDVPRIFLVLEDKTLFLFDCRFDESKEDYETTYHVFLMPDLKEDDISGTWVRLSERAIEYLGETPVKEVKFDKTRRRSIDNKVLSQLRT